MVNICVKLTTFFSINYLGYMTVETKLIKLFYGFPIYVDIIYMATIT